MSICCIVVEIRELAVGDDDKRHWRQCTGTAEQIDVRGKLSLAGRRDL